MKLTKHQKDLMHKLDSQDPDIRRHALNQVPAIPMPPWAQEIYTRIAATPHHPLRYDAMLLINSGMIPCPRFDAMLDDPDPKIRAAAYCNLAIHGRLPDVLRLAEGMNDKDPDVRETALNCLVETLDGSEIDKREPFFKRKWKAPERADVARLKTLLKEGFARAVAQETGEAQSVARVGLTIVSHA